MINDVNLNNLPILEVDTINFVGITVNKYLNWSDHIFVVKNYLTRWALWTGEVSYS